MREAIRLKRAAIRTEATYVWITRFALFHNTRHPQAMGAAAVAAFRFLLVVPDHISVATRPQVLAAQPFRHQEILQRKPGAIAAIRVRTCPGAVGQVIGRLPGVQTSRVPFCLYRVTD